MTDEQIVRALECCASSTGCDACRGCPFNEDKLCDKDRFALEKHLLSLIKRQQAEIERYKGVIRLLEKDVADAKAEAVREFAERLKKWKYQSSDWSHGEHPFVVEETDIDELVIEMTEGKENG